MKALRFLLYLLAGLVFLALVAVLVAFIPDVQTSFVRSLVADHLQLGLKLDGAVLRPDSVSLDNVTGEVNGARITVPHVESTVSLYDVYFHQRIGLQTLVAHGWTVDYTKPKVTPAPGTKAPPAVPAPPPPSAAEQAQASLKAMTGLLQRLSIPCDAIDGVDLEGDIIFPNPVGVGTSRIHVTASGGGLRPGATGDLSYSVATGITSADAELTEVNLQGDVGLTEALDHSVTSLRTRVDASIRGPLVPEGRTFQLVIEAAHKDGETYGLTWRRDARTVFAAQGSLADPSPRITGTWTGAFTQDDVAFLGLKATLPTFTATGKGTFDSGQALGKPEAEGQLSGPISDTDKLGLGLPTLPTLQIEMAFRAWYGPEAIHVESFSAKIAGERPILVAHSLKPFEWDTSGGSVKVGDDDWIAVNVTGLPVAWLPPLPSGLALKGTDSSGEFTVRRGDGGITLKSKTPWTARGIEVVKEGSVVIPTSDLSANLAIDASLGGWKAEAKPLKLSNGGEEVASASLTLTPSTYQTQPSTIVGTWSANIPWLAKLPILARFGTLPGTSASGDVSWNFGAQDYGEGNLKVQGQDDKHVLTASLNAGFDEYGRLQFKVPVKITEGNASYDVEFGGKWIPGEKGDRLEVEMGGDSMTARDLRRLATPFAALSKVTIPDYPFNLGGANGPKDAVPFWGQWTGTIHYSFRRFDNGNGPLVNVRGVIVADEHSLSLNGAQWVVGMSHPATLEGSVKFEPTFDRPYTLTGKGTLADQDAKEIFATAAGDDPLVEGKFSIETSYTGDGTNLGDLVSHSAQGLHYTSKIGIIRILKVNVADAVPEVKTPVRDSVNSVGNVVGAVFGAHNVGNGHNKVDKKAQTVIDFTNEIPEIGYDFLSLTVVRSMDGAIRLDDIQLSAPEERIVGSGRLAPAPGKGIKDQPISLDLTLSFKGRAADLARASGLLSDRIDPDGYTFIKEPVHFGGSIASFDPKGWHDFLYKAAAPDPAPAATEPSK